MLVKDNSSMYIVTGGGINKDEIIGIYTTRLKAWYGIINEVRLQRSWWNAYRKEHAKLPYTKDELGTIREQLEDHKIKECILNRIREENKDFCASLKRR